jgi:hypothetical protein
MRLIDADALYERTCSLEAQALDYVGKLIERDGKETSVEWKIWSAILTERTAFKHDLFDAPTIEERAKGRWILDQKSGRRICSECLAVAARDDFGKEYLSDYCTVCGADMRGEQS